MKNITDEEFRLLADYIKANFGINLSEQKKTLLVNRLYKLVASLNLNSITDYYEYLLNEKSGKAKIELVNNITTNHTFFMREISHFKFFANEVLPYISKNIRDYDLRTDKPFEILLIGMDDKKSVSIKGTANNEYYNQYVSFITWNTSTKELFKNNKKIMLLLPEEKGIKVEFETADFEKIEGKISKTSWAKIQEFETKYEQEN